MTLDLLRLRIAHSRLGVHPRVWSQPPPDPLREILEVLIAEAEAQELAAQASRIAVQPPTPAEPARADPIPYLELRARMTALTETLRAECNACRSNGHEAISRETKRYWFGQADAAENAASRILKALEKQEGDADD